MDNATTINIHQASVSGYKWEIHKPPGILAPSMVVYLELDLPLTIIPPVLAIVKHGTLGKHHSNL